MVNCLCIVGCKVEWNEMADGYGMTSDRVVRTVEAPLTRGGRAHAK
jgi:hypothetical protein